MGLIVGEYTLPTGREHLHYVKDVFQWFILAKFHPFNDFAKTSFKLIKSFLSKKDYEIDLKEIPSFHCINDVEFKIYHWTIHQI